jgi:hypothetical protein
MTPTEQRLQLREAGFSPVPVCGKKVPLLEWTSKTITNPDEISLWSTIYPYATNTGILTRLTPVLDIDILVPDAAAAIETLVRSRFEDRGRILVRTGSAPKRAIPFRIDDVPFKKITANVIAPNETEQKIELLADGQQMVCFGTHPDTHRAYAWFGGQPGEIRREDLPFLSETEANALVLESVRLLVSDFGFKEKTSQTKETGNGSDPNAWADLWGNIHKGHSLHDSLLALSAKLVSSGMESGAIASLLRAAMQSTSAPHDARWKERHDEIPRLVTSAVNKFRGPKAEPRAVPVDLWASFDPPELPKECLPNTIEGFARGESRIMGADAAGLAMAALTVCAAAIPDSIKLQVKKYSEHWTEPARLWTALIGDPSTKKSPILRQATWPLARIDGRLFGRYKTELETYESLSADEKKQRNPPEQRRVRIEDTTIEAAQQVLKSSPEGVLCLQDELSGWFGSMDKYVGSRGAQKDRGFWLQSYNGGEYVCNRIGRGSFIIPNLSVSMLGGIQAELIRKLAADGVDDGLLQRICPIVLQTSPTMGQDEPNDSASYYGDLIDQLHLMRIPNFVLRFDDSAQEIRNRLEQKHLDLMTCEAVSKKLAAHIGKL